MDNWTSSISILSAMITPAVLISACGSLVLSTSNRLGRVVDRVRTISAEFEEINNRRTELSADKFEAKCEMYYDQLNRLSSRARLLQRSLTAYYLAISIFVAASVAIGIAGISQTRYSSIPVILGLIGGTFLLYGSSLLIYEARLALESTFREMNYIRDEMNNKYLTDKREVAKFDNPSRPIVADNRSESGSSEDIKTRNIKKA